MSNMEQLAIDRLMQVIHRQNETIDSQYTTILHLEEKIRQYEKMESDR
jgi:hypothetical protein